MTMLFQMFTFAIYLRYIIEAFQFLLMTTISEILEFKQVESSTHEVSFYIACGMAAS